MPFEILHFRGADTILEQKNMTREIRLVMEYLDDCLYGTYRKGELLRQALQEMDWREEGVLTVLDGRRYYYKGFRKRVAMDGSFSSYEYIQDALLKLQVGFDKEKIDMGIVLVTAQRSEKSRLGTTRDIVDEEIEMLYPTISLPVTIVLFDLGRPGELYEEAEAALPTDKVDEATGTETEKPEPAELDKPEEPSPPTATTATKKKKSRAKSKQAA